MANGGRIDWTLGFKVDKTGLNDAKIALQNLKTGFTPTDLFNMNPGKFKNISSDARKALSEIKQDIESVQTAFNQAFDTTTGQMNLTKLNTSLKQLDINKIYSSFSMLGKQGEQAFYKMTKAALSANTQFLKTKSILDSMGQTLLNTLKWNISSSLINRFTGSIRQAYGYVQHLDSSLNDIRIVTGKSADEMERFAERANKAAKNLGKSTTEYTEASLIYYQQGLSDEETAARAETTLKAANVTGQSPQAVSEQLTAVWNGYKVSAENTEQAVDKLAAVAATTAADLEELSVGMSKVASAANSMGVDMDQLNATIATIESVTRQAPESVGTALKTIYARMGDLKLGDTDEDGLKLGDVSSTLQKVGIDILDVNGELRDMGVIIEEIGNKWGTWTKAQQTAIAESVAGKRQYNNLFALFDNWDMYNKALETSRDSTGTLQQQQDIYMESTAAHIQQLKTQLEDLYDSLLDEKSINKLLSGLTSALSLFTNFIDSIGGSSNVLLLLGSTFTKVFQKQIGVEIGNAILKMQQAKDNAQQLAAQMQNIQLFKNSQGMQITGVNELVNAYDKIKNYYGILNEEGLEQANVLAQQVAEAALLKEEFEENTKLLNTYVQTSGASGVKTFDAINNRTNTGLRIFDEKSKQDLDLLKQIDREFKNVAADAEVFANTFIDQTTRSNVGFKQLRDTIIQCDGMYDNLSTDAESNFSIIYDEINRTYNAFSQLSDGLKSTVPELKAVDEAFEQMNKASSKAAYDKAVRQFIQAVIEAKPKAQNLLQEMQRLKEVGPEVAQSLDSAKQSLNNFLQNEYVKQFSVNITNTIGSIGQLASGISALSNLDDIFTNENLKSSEKFLQIITSLGFALPMIITNLKSVVAGFSQFRTLGQMATSSILAMITGVDALTLAEGALNNKTQAEIISLYGEAVAREWNEGKLTQESIALVINTQAKRANISVTVLLAKAIKTKLLTALASVGKFLVTTVPGWITLITSAIIAITSFFNINKEKAAIQAETDLNISQKNLESINEYTENVEKLVESYKELKTQYDDQEISLNGLRNQIYDIANEYGIQLDAIQLLTASYEELNDIMIQVHNEALSSQSAAKQDVINQKRNKLIKEGEAYSANTSGFKDTIEAIGAPWMVTEATLEGMGDFFLDRKGNVNWEYYYNATQEEQNKFIDFLNSYVNNFGLDMDRAQDALDYINEHQSDFDELMTEENIQKKDTVSNIFKTLTQENEPISPSDIEDLKKQMVEQLIPALGVSEEEALQLAQEEINKQPSLLTINATIDVATELSSQWGKDVSEIEEELSNLSSSDLQLIVENKDIVATYKSLDDFLSKFKDTSNFLKKQENILAVRVALTNTDGTQFKPEDIDTLFDTSSFAEDNNITKEQFLELDYNTQLQSLLDYYIVANQQSNEYKENAINNLKDQQEEIENNKNILLELKNLYDEEDLKHATEEDSYLSYQIENIKTATQELNLAEEDIKNLLVEYSNGQIDNNDQNIAAIHLLTGLTDEQIQHLGELVKIQQVYNDTTKDFNKDGKGYSKLLNTLNHDTEDLNNQIEVVENTTADWSGTLELAKTRMSSINNQIDNLQSAYSSLTSIMEEYNETGILSMDNLQTLLEMDTAYLSALQIENGQMSLNEEGLKEIALARLDEAEATAYEEAMAELNELAQNGAAAATANAGSATVITTGNIRECIAALQDGAIAWDNYWASVEQSAGLKNEQTQAIGDSLKNKLTAIGQVREQILSGGDLGFSSTMKGPSAATEKGSSTEKAKEVDHEEYLEREEDIYRTINEELEQIESTLGRIQTINDHEWGIDAQKTLEEENKLLDEQLKKLEEKRDLQLGDLATRRKQLEDVGVQFSDDGSAMLNAEGQLNKLYAQYNSMVDHYNSLSADAQEVYKAELEAEKEKIDTIEKKMDEYESGFSDYQSTLDEILDTHYAAIENEVNQFNNMVDVHLELKDAEKEWNDFWKEVVEDVQETDFAGQIAASLRQLNTLVGTPFDNADSTVTTLTNHLKETVAEVQAQIASANRGGEDSLFGDDTLASKENLEKYRDSLMEALRSAKGEIDNISENYLKMLDDTQKQIDEQVEGWNSIGDQIEHDVELIKLISGDKAFEALNKQYDKQYENDLKLINTQKQSQDFWKQQIERYQKLVDTTDNTTVQWKTYNDSLNKSIENYRKATADLDKTVQESIKDLQTWRENNVKAITDTLDKAMSGGLGLDNIEQEWKLINDYADQYYDNVERAFNMEDYTNILDDAANAIGLSAENQAKLNNFRQQELAQLNAKNKLTQYDIDESKARLEILKAEIALQDTQRNKSNMRLRRDNQGNYVYQYTGDEAEQDKAENGLLTARREWYELVKKRNKETNDYIIQLGKERIDLQTQLAEAQLQGDTERINLLLRLIKENEQQQVFAYEQAEKAKRDLIKGTAEYFAEVENADVLPMWNTTINQLVDKWAKSEDSFIQSSIKAIKDLQGVQDEYNIRTKEVLEEAGINYLKLRDEGIDPTKDSLDELTGSNEDLADALDNVNGLLSEQETNLRNAETAYLNLKDAAVGAIMAANQALAQLSQTAIRTVQQVQAAVTAAQSAQSILNSRLNNSVNNYNNGGNGPISTQSLNNPIRPTSTTTSRAGNSYSVYTDPNGVKGTYGISIDGQLAYVNASLTSVIDWLKRNKYHRGEGSWLLGMDPTKYIPQFDSGGYTGAWGNTGKAAILHEKELVLNKDDTTNILKAVEMMRQVAQLSGIGNNLLNSSMTSSNMLAKINAGILQGTNNFNTNNTNSNKNMSMVINADFSGVRSADEIYQALIELQNYGLQENYSVAPHINIGY